MSLLGDNTRFLLRFLRHPKAVGSIVPSSRWLTARMVHEMDLGRAETVVELGPGTGVLTQAIAEAAGAQTRVIAVELDGKFAATLSAKYPGIRVVTGSAEHLSDHLRAHGRSVADCILSSLPWTMFSPELQSKIIDSILGSLRAGGKFATYAYVHAAWFPRARRFRRMLEERFRTVVNTRVVWRNVPPAVVYRCQK